MVSELRQVGVELGSLVKLLGDNLYSTPETFLRELVQNAHDAITRRHIETPTLDAPVILVSAQRNGAGRPILVIEDNGCGLTVDEIHRYLATIGRGMTAELRNRSLDQANGDACLIGAFGLGFLSAYVVSEVTHFITTSYQTPNETWAFTSRGGNSYNVDRWQEVRPVGTRLELVLKSEFEHLHAHGALFQAVGRSCALLPHPIYISSVETHNQINGNIPPWRLNREGMPWVRWHTEALDWLNNQDDAYPPLAVLPVGGEEGSVARGILWLNDFQSFANNDNRSVKVYIRNMLVANNERELLPHWAGFVSAAIEANGLTPTASREALRRDDIYAQVREQLERDLVRGLTQLVTAAPSSAQNALWKRIRSLHNQSLLIASCADDNLMSALQSELELETSAGRYTAAGLADLGDKRVYVSSGRSGVDALFAKVRGQPVVDGRVVGQRLFLELFFSEEPERLVSLGQDDHDRLFPRRAADDAVATFVRNHLMQSGDDLRFTAFAPATLPIVRIWNEYALARQRLDEDESRRRISLGALRLAKAVLEKEAGDAQSFLYVNLSSPIWTHIVNAAPSQQTIAADFLKSFMVLLDENSGPGREKALEEALSSFVNGLLAVAGPVQSDDIQAIPTPLPLIS